MGRKHSEESKQKMSLQRRGIERKPLSKEHPPKNTKSIPCPKKKAIVIQQKLDEKSPPFNQLK